ncbi:metal-dependent hydrolase [Muriicola sp.]|uniref:metal-dependent hydrolase n=1 Tax=Muriicola sp. TaxID=2020856 RepID=UPI003C753DC2
MKITFLGHASLLVELKDHTILVDPFITGNPMVPDTLSIKQLKPDYILLTHAHQDHVLDVEEIAKHSNPKIISNYEIATYFEKKGLRVHPMNHGGSWSFSFGMVKYVQAVHTSSFADGSYGGQPGGFILSAEGKTVYIAGDTALTIDMKLIPMQFSLDLAVLPIGDNFTMGIEDAVLAAGFVECSKILGYHYDTFGYIEIDHKKAKETFQKAGKELNLLAIGESMNI